MYNNRQPNFLHPQVYNSYKNLTIMYTLKYLFNGSNEAYDVENEFLNYLISLNEFSAKQIKLFKKKKLNLINEFIDLFYRQILTKNVKTNNAIKKEVIFLNSNFLRKEFGTSTNNKKKEIYNYQLCRDFLKSINVLNYIEYKVESADFKTYVDYYFSKRYIGSFDYQDDIFSELEEKYYINDDKIDVILENKSVLEIIEYINDLYVNDSFQFKINIQNTKPCIENTITQLGEIVKNVEIDLPAAVTEILNNYDSNKLIKKVKEWKEFVNVAGKTVRYFKIINKYFEYTDLVYQINLLAKFQKYRWLSTSDNTRVYSSLTAMPSSLRKYLKIDNEELVEIDASNSQPHLLNLVVVRYIDQHKLKLTDDDIEELKRYKELTGTGKLYEQLTKLYNDYLKNKVIKNDSLNIKRIFLNKPLKSYRCINLSHDKSLFKTEIIGNIFFSKDLNKNGKLFINTSLKKIFKDNFNFIYSIIVKIKKTNHADLSLLLQKVEAEIIIHEGAKQLLNASIKCVTIHDGLLVKKSDYNKALNIIKSIYDNKGIPAHFKSK